MSRFRNSLTNYEFKEENQGGKTTFYKVGIEAPEIWANLKNMSNNYIKRIRSRVFANGGDRLIYLDEPNSLFGWMSAHNIHPDWGKANDMISKSEFLKYIGNVADEYEFAASLPHYPPVEGFYYINKIEPRKTGLLDPFLGFFSPATDKDRSIIKAAIVTPSWGGPFGCRPAFLIDGLDTDEQGNRGVGKTALTDAIALLYNGQIDLSKKVDANDARKLMLTADDVRIVRFDNIKDGSLSSETIESLITSPIINGHRMYVGYCSIPNWFTYYLTFNDAQMSKDMAQRAMIIRLKRPKYRAEWLTEVNEFIMKNRNDLLADIGYLLSQEIQSFEVATRFPKWERDVLGRCTDNIITVQTAIATDREAVDETVSLREEFGDYCHERLAGMVKKEPIGTYAIRRSWVVSWLQQFDTNRKLSKKSATKLLMTILPQGFGKETKVNDGIDYLIWNDSWHDGKEFLPTGAQRLISTENGVRLSTWDFKKVDDFSDVR